MKLRTGLLGLLLVAVAGTGQAVHAVEAEQAPIGWVCEVAFEVAAQAIDPAAAQGDPPTAEGDPPTAEIDPGEDVTRLDDAVRLCVSPEEWATAAARFPDLFGSTDPLEFFASRCTDPEAGLHDYTACHAYLLAQAEADDAEPPTDVAPLDEPEVRLSDQEPVALPQPMKAYVPGATRERWFEVQGNSVDELLATTLVEAGRFCGGDDTLACVKNGWKGSWKKRTNRRTGQCRVASFTASLRATVYMPRWAGPALVHPDILIWWRGFLRRAAWHEGRHIEIQRLRLGELEQQVEGKPCRQTGGIIRRWEKGTQQAHREFDAIEQEIGLPLRPEYWLRR